MNGLPKSVETLISEFTKFPGIGKKTAQRLAFHVLSSSTEKASRFASSIVDVKTLVRSCTICGGISDEDLCEICKNNKRDQTVICVVERQEDIFAIEKTNSFLFLLPDIQSSVCNCFLLSAQLKISNVK